MSSYQVIARKWRPSLFEEIVGQAHVTTTLKNAVASGRIAHAYLFCGPRGVGKTTAARILAKCLNCANGPTAAPCNECGVCKSVAAGSSVDVIEIDGASNNGVENVRELRESVRYLPGSGKYKVYIVDEVHMLSTAAFNALLKTLEEPPPHAVFILATTESHKIPATIVSRCQRFDFRRIPFKDIQAHLKKIVTAESIGFEEEALYTIAREADGSLRDAQSLLEQVAAYSAERVTDASVAEALGLLDRNILYDLSQAILSSDGRACLNHVEKIYDFGYDLKRACASLLGYLRDLAVWKAAGATALPNLPDADLERLGAQADSASAERLQMIFGIMSKGYEEIGRASEPRHSLEMSLLRAAHAEGLESVQSAIARLAELKRQLGSGQTALPVQAAKASEGYKAQPGAAGAATAQPKKAAPLAPVDAPIDAPVDISGDGLREFIISRKPSWAVALRGAVMDIAETAVEISPEAAQYGFLNGYINDLGGLCSEYLRKTVKAVVKQTGQTGQTGQAGQAGQAAGAAVDKTSPVDLAVKETLRALGGRVIEDRRRTNV
ncbi:MAG: DNA polymerase III subunit gamma/tau [Deltaproteobacteria bacterium]|nr:DNA polymerase III subunit gamma/tau [Deltaproteobacteria bacterium]